VKTRMTLPQAQRMVDSWNRDCPPGTDVVLTNDLGKTERTRTRSEAWLLGHGAPVVKVEGRTGGYLLTRLRPEKAKEAL